MKSRDLVLAALRGEPTERTPVLSVCQHATYEQMEEHDAYWPEAHSDARQMAALAGSGAVSLGLDAVRVPFCQTNEAEVLGAVLKKGGRTIIPSIDIHPYLIGEAVTIPDDFLDRGCLPALLEAIRLLKARFGDEVAVMGGVVGPFSIATSLLGTPPLLKTSYKNPGAVRQYLEAGERAGTLLARAMVAAGADVIVVEDMMASLDMISPKIYRELVAPYETAQIGQIPAPVIIHICGAVDPIMPDIARTGAAAISVEHRVNVAAVLERFRSEGLTTPIAGNIDPVGVLCQNDRESVIQAVQQAVAAGVSIVSPGCAVAPDTPTANLLAMVAAARSELRTNPSPLSGAEGSVSCSA
jgi:[methyl-Co(III) methanol-specific corrinoid protein]:coenzyme M methyltransferase